MAATPLHRPAPPPLPVTLDDWDAQRRSKINRTINDLVEDIHRRLLADPERSLMYQKLMAAIYDEQAVERKLVVDDVMLAQMIREKSSQDDTYVDLAKESLGAIMQAHQVVLRRYGQSRKDRREMVGGVRVPEEQQQPPRKEYNNGDGE
jgi:hypothetical protein